LSGRQSYDVTVSRCPLVPAAGRCSGALPAGTGEQARGARGVGGARPRAPVDGNRADDDDEHQNH